MNFLVNCLSIICVAAIYPLYAETPLSISLDSGGVTINGTKVSSLSNGPNPTLTITLEQLSTILGRPSRVEHGRKSSTEIDLWDASGIFLCPGANVDHFGVSLSNEFAVTRSPQGVFNGTLSIEKIPISLDVSVSLINTQLDELTFRQVEMFSWGTSWELKYPTHVVELICNKQGKITAVHISAKSKKDLANPPSQTEANTSTNLPPVPETRKLSNVGDQNTLHAPTELPIVTLRESPAEQCSVAERALDKAWSDLTPQQKSALRKGERDWIKIKDSMAVNDPGRLEEIQKRTQYLKSFSMSSTSTEAIPNFGYARRIVGQWQGTRHICAFYKNGGFALDPQPGDEPIGKWRVEGDKIITQYGDGSSEVIERIVEFTTGIMIVESNGKRYSFKRLK
jgi:hypothetical protein